jgi:hypothetical protein
MGSKRRWAPMLVPALGVDRPGRVVLVDAGPWGDVWSVLRVREHRARAAELLESWDDEPAPDLWARLVEQPPALDLPWFRAAQFLWLQARSAGTIPVWWSGTRWESPTGSRTEAAHQRGGAPLVRRCKGAASAIEAGRGGRCRGIQRPSTIARRIGHIDAIDWSRVEVIHGRAENVEPIRGATVYLDPPYVGAPRYAEAFPRTRVVAVAERWADAGARVAISEAEPLRELRGWATRRLASRKAEWITASWPIALPEQLDLWRAA